MTFKISEIKNNYIWGFLLVSLLFVNDIKAQNGNFNNEKITKANEILLNAQKAIGLGEEKLKVQKLSVIYTVSRNTKQSLKERSLERENQDSGERELHVMLLNKFKFLETINLEDTVWITKFNMDGGVLDFDRYGIWEGKRTEIEIKGQENPTEEQKKQKLLEKKEELFYILFPILLEGSSLLPLEFKYIGKAELNGEKTDVLETTLNEETKTRLFFDDTSNLLKMMITITQYKDGTYLEEKRFYSDYKVVEGLKIAKKINVEIKQTSKQVESESIEEQTLKTLKINPTFKPNFFEVKKK